MLPATPEVKPMTVLVRNNGSFVVASARIARQRAL
jgi:hypothetical protein